MRKFPIFNYLLLISEALSTMLRGNFNGCVALTVINVGKK